MADILVTFGKPETVGQSALVDLASVRTEAIAISGSTVLGTIAAKSGEVCTIKAGGDCWVAANKMDSTKRVPLSADETREFALNANDKIAVIQR